MTHRELSNGWGARARWSRRQIVVGGAVAGAGAVALRQPARGRAQSATPAASPVAAGGTREITTPLGTYAIPIAPQRVVTIDSRLDLEPALALELPVIATCYDAPTPWVPAPDDLLVFPGEVDLEQIVALNPDLIVCVNLDSEWWPAPALNEIAPVVTTEFMVHWRENLAQLSTWLGTSDRLETALTEYDDLVAGVQARHGDKVAESQIIYLQYFADEGQIYFNGQYFLPGYVLDDLGGTLHLGIQDTDHWVISLERLNELAGADGFLVQSWDDAYDRLSAEPLWQTLPAVKAGAVMVANDNTNYGSIYTARELVGIFDELFSKIE